MGKNYEVIEHTADIGLKIFGKTKKELFQNAARGMFFLITGSSIFFKEESNNKYFKVECEASNLEDLLVSWLSDLLHIHNTEYMIPGDFIINHLTEQFIQSEIVGVKITDSLHQIEKEIKAVTYHHLQVFKNEKGRWEANIVFDL